MVIGAVVLLQALQTAQVAILRRDVKRSLRPPPPLATMPELRTRDLTCAICDHFELEHMTERRSPFNALSWACDVQGCNCAGFRRQQHR